MRRILLKGGDVIDGLGNRHEGADLLIESERIAHIGPGASTADCTINVAGKTVMPGLIDCHVHLCKGHVSGEDPLWARGPELTEQEAGFLHETPGALRDLASGLHHARWTLESGYTTVRDVGLARGYSDIVLRETSARHPSAFPGPRILACGGGLAITGGHGWYFEDGPALLEVDGVDAARKAARQQLKAGADLIKVMATRAGGTMLMSGGPEFTVQEMRVICEEAHRLGKRVAAHAVGAQGIKNAITAGVDTIEHGCLADEEALDMMVEHSTWLISTLYPFHRQAHIAVQHGYPDDVAAPSLAIMETYPQMLRQALAKRVNIALGSDCGLRKLTPHGENARELELFVKLVGVSAMQAIELATRAAAGALGLEHELGTLEVGKRADILVIDGDPLADICVLQDRGKIALVLKDGKVMVIQEGLAP